MKTSVLLTLMSAGFCFGVWPIVMRRSDIPQLAQGLVMTIMTTTIIGVAWFRNGSASWSALLVVGLGFAIVAGVLNGFGSLAFFRGINAVSRADLSRAILVIVLTQIVTNEIGGIAVNGAPITVRRLLGFGTAAVSVFLLVR